MATCRMLACPQTASAFEPATPRCGRWRSLRKPPRASPPADQKPSAAPRAEWRPARPLRHAGASLACQAPGPAIARHLAVAVPATALVIAPVTPVGSSRPRRAHRLRALNAAREAAPRRQPAWHGPRSSRRQSCQQSCRRASLDHRNSNPGYNCPAQDLRLDNLQHQSGPSTSPWAPPAAWRTLSCCRRRRGRS